MEKKKKTIGLSSLLLCLAVLAGCQGQESSPSSSTSTVPPSTPNSSVSSSSTPGSSSSSSTPWTPGSDALEDAKQPEVKDPIGARSALNRLNASQGKPGMPSLGDVNLLVVPVQLSDQEDISEVFDDQLLKNLDGTFFGEGADFPSVKEFYEESSGYSLHLDGVTTPVVEIEETLDDAIATIGSKGMAGFLSGVTSEVYDYLFVDETRTYDPADFDSDDDGKIDGIVLVNPMLSLLVYQMFGISSTGDTSYDALLSDASLFEDSLSAPVNSVSWTSVFASLYYSIIHYGLEQIPLIPDSHFYINFVGAMMGLDSYYDFTGNSTTGTYRAPLAMTDRMDGYIGDHNPFSKYQLGWLSPSVYTPENVPAEGVDVTVSAESPIVLSYADDGLYGEYLLVDLYTPTGLNQADAKEPYIYGRSTFSKAGIRVYEVNSTLARGRENQYVPYVGEPDYEATYLSANGSQQKYSYAYRHSNSSVNPLSEYGIMDKEPLLSLLSKKGMNRHITDFNVSLSDDDLFHAGDAFDQGDVPGFYKDFAFDSGTALGITFTVKSIDEASGSAVLTLRRAN